MVPSLSPTLWVMTVMTATGHPQHTLLADACVMQCHVAPDTTRPLSCAVLSCGVVWCGLPTPALCVQMYASPAGAKPPAQPAAADQQQLMAHDLGLDKQLPWNDK